MAARPRHREDRWYRSHPDLVRRLAGQWVVVEGERLVAHHADPVRALDQARARGVAVPYLLYVQRASGARRR